MRRLAVFAEAFAMVRRHGNDGRSVRPGLVDTLHEGADLRVHERHFAVVRPCAEARPVRLWRLIGRMRVEQVHPQEHRPGLTGRRLTEPRLHRGDRLVGPALDGGRTGAVPSSREPIVVVIEATREPEPPMQGKARDERRGRIAAGAKPFGERRHRRTQHEADVVPHAVRERRRRREDRCV
jgi:hypothetical protein